MITIISAPFSFYFSFLLFVGKRIGIVPFLCPPALIGFVRHGEVDPGPLHQVAVPEIVSGGRLPIDLYFADVAGVCLVSGRIDLHLFSIFKMKGHLLKQG